ncbi:hypothetical protein BT67DRAFT_369970 [Trichocladium antarcticum]|uniref:Lipid droplet-associated hydrolase n=1 Tax=Trichocladium antarcticum TaxID=1450529 RepID=A0AAN6UTR0_9PEZI|nr:hypothetical protein BT67DRAFT_369970 [Trichocladium antarcticum]
MDSPVARKTSVKQTEVPSLDYPSAKQHDLTRRQCLIFMIPGNPGLIDYYIPFLGTLRQLLDETESKDGCEVAFHIYGRNLIGFDDRDHEPAFGTSTATGSPTEPFSLEDQIRCLCDQVQHVNQSTLPSGRAFDEILLIGHSVGAYMALEIFHRHHQALALALRPASGQHAAPTTLAHVPLKAGILLFPTVTHIARSGSGQKLDLVRRNALLARSAHRLAKGFVDLWPRWALDAVVRRVLGFPAHAAAATTRFLAGRDGIWQAIHMGKDEMATIAEEKWGEELWEEGVRGAGAEEMAEGGAATKFFFYFARTDHWVADECRDEFIARRRAHEKGRTEIVICEEKIPHAFCIHHSETVAEKVRLWVEDVAGL